MQLKKNCRTKWFFSIVLENVCFIKITILFTHAGTKTCLEQKILLLKLTKIISHDHYNRNFSITDQPQSLPLYALTYVTSHLLAIGGDGGSGGGDNGGGVRARPLSTATFALHEDGTPPSDWSERVV